MIDLNNEATIKESDKFHVADSIAAFPDQISQAWGEAKQVQFPDSYKTCSRILIAGMGGSALGPEMISFLYQDKLKDTVTILRDYTLSAFADQKTLVVLSSYSGTTEEVLSVAKQAQERGCQITAISEGRALEEFVKGNDLPAYIFEAKFNPSGQPRLGLGYSVAGILGLFEALGLVEVTDSQISEVKNFLSGLNQSLSPSIATANNKAKSLATSLYGSGVAIIAGEFLRGNAHIFSNQINENAKNFAVPFLLSELNHHLLEGLTYPVELKSKLKFVSLNSKLYSERISKRVEITKIVLEKQGYQNLSVELTGATRLTEAFEAILISSWASFYLGVLNGVDPAKIPWVDFFKEELAKS